MSSSTQAGPITKFIIAIIFVIIGYFVTFSFGLPILNDAKASTEWPIVSGKIISSELVKSRDKGKTMYSSDVQYRYAIDGRNYEGNNVAFGTSGTSSSNAKSARETVNKYQKDDAVDVYYDPNEPYNSVLEPGTTWASYVVFGLGAIFLLIGVLILGGTIFQIIFGLAIITAALGGLIGKKSNPAQNYANNTDPKQGFNKTNHSISHSKNNKNDADDGFDIG